MTYLTFTGLEKARGLLQILEICCIGIDVFVGVKI